MLVMHLATNKQGFLLMQVTVGHAEDAMFPSLLAIKIEYVVML